MIVHDFICDNCGVVIQDTDTRKIHRCKNCDSDMRWDCNVAIHGNYSCPVHSASLAISPSQIEEHKKMFPNIRLDGECRPIFDNFTEHENYLKKSNMIKEPQRIRGNKDRIYGKKRTKSRKSSVQAS